MDPVQIVTVWMKFMSDVDWIAEKNTASSASTTSGDLSGIGRDTIRHSSNATKQDLTLRVNSGKKNRRAIVMPVLGESEKTTILNCIQNRLYATDYANADNYNDETDAKTLLTCYKLNTDGPIFLDPTMTVNFFGHLSPSFVRELQVETRKGLACIHYHGGGGDVSNSITSSIGGLSPFRQLFLEHIRFWRRYDGYIRINLNDIQFPTTNTTDGKARFWGEDVTDLGYYESFARGVVRVLRMALGDRVTAVRLLTTGNGEDAMDNGDISRNESGGCEDLGMMELVDSDQIPLLPMRGGSGGSSTNQSMSPPVGKGNDKHNSNNNNNNNNNTVVIGIRMNPDTCHRIVDRGPPADNTIATEDFVNLWGDKKAQLRRFKDGAIVRAVVWDGAAAGSEDGGLIRYGGSDKTGHIVEHIVRHVMGFHFGGGMDSNAGGGPKFALRGMRSLIEGVVLSSNTNDTLSDSTAAHKDIMLAFDSLSSFLKDNTIAVPTASDANGISKLGLPLPINSLEALSPSLRYSDLFPPTPHELLGGETKNTGKKIAGVTMGNAILIQICFKKSNKWPLDINAMGAAKCAMLLQLAEGIEKMKENGKVDMSLFNGPTNVTPSHLDLGYQGYPWRIVIRADQELDMLNALRNPSADAIALREVLTKRHVINALHHFTIHGVHSKHPAAMGVVRLAKRWVAAHMLSGLISHEAIELLVASVFTEPAPLHTPSTVSCGFVRFLFLVAAHDWMRNPLIVDPEGHVNADDRASIISEFELVRGTNMENGPPMYIVSPSDRGEDMWKPTFTHNKPEKVILSRIRALAKRSHQYLMANIISSDQSNDDEIWMSIFKENPNSLKSYSALLRVNHSLIVDSHCSSTGSDLTTSRLLSN